MNRRTPDLHCHDRVEHANGGLERFQVVVLVGEDAEMVVVHPQTYASMNVLLGRLEPRVTLCLGYGDW